MCQAILLALILFSVCSQSCSRFDSKLDSIDKTSPNGLFRVKIRFSTGNDNLEKGAFQFFKGQEVVKSYELRQQDQYEPSVSSLVPVVEWVDNNVLRMGAQRLNQTFSDEVTIQNHTDEYFKYVGISYDRYESFDIFDLAPRSQVILHATPRFAPKGTHNNSFGYSGLTQSGKEFGNVVVAPERESSAAGPLKFMVTISKKDLR